MNKIHCKNCKFDKSYSGWAGMWATYAELALGISLTGCVKKAERVKTEYSCPYYEHKWWKFWAR